MRLGVKFQQNFKNKTSDNVLKNVLKSDFLKV